MLLYILALKPADGCADRDFIGGVFDYFPEDILSFVESAKCVSLSPSNYSRRYIIVLILPQRDFEVAKRKYIRCHYQDCRFHPTPSQ